MSAATNAARTAYWFTVQEYNTILAALRCYEWALANGAVLPNDLDNFTDIADCGCTEVALDSEGVGNLADRLNAGECE